MQLELVAEVEGEGVAPQIFSVAFDDFTVEVRPNPKGDVTHLAVRKRLDDYKQYLPSIEKRGDASHHIAIPENPVHSEFVGLLQYLESVGSFWFGFHRIRWDSAEFSWIPESDAEKQQIQISSFKARSEYDPTPRPVVPQTLRQLIQDRDRHAWLVLPMSFFREGMREFRQMRYINAFFNFYFYLEDLYGAGKWRTKQVLESFTSSRELCGCVKFVMSKLEEPTNARHRRALEEFLVSKGCQYGVPGILKLIVHLRGNLHHFSQRSSTLKGHPLNQHRFETPAFILMGICLDSAAMAFTGMGHVQASRKDT